MSNKQRRDTTVEYEPIEEHPDGLKPPYPCNRWAAKITKTHDGEEVDRAIMPWLDECFGKQVSCGAAYNPETKKIEPAFRDHQGFDEIDYIVIEENAFKYDEEGEILMEKNEETGQETPVSDFKYIAGINAVNFIAEHTFRIASMSAQNGKQTAMMMQSVNNNLVQSCKIQSYVAKQLTPEGGDPKKIAAVQDQSALPNGPNGPRINPT